MEKYYFVRNVCKFIEILGKCPIKEIIKCPNHQFTLTDNGLRLLVVNNQSTQVMVQVAAVIV
ncbi:hypothetical protein TRIP_C20053 [Candidatus Zixiibacteriota bacterium]|nr:hypothetical protein TRIP_C20053 [candidate division Zixibacteria bacterium]